MPELPALCGGVWLAFLALSRRRGSNGMGGAHPLDETRVLAWQQIHGERLTPWEVDCIFSLDDAWLSVRAEAQQDNPSA